MKFEKNVGMVDRVFRGIAGVLLVVAGAMYVQPPTSYASIFVGLALIVTALIGICTIYSLIGINTLNCPVCNFMEKKK
ncbi:DUF2892 domain-containing protein [Candidatus Micrarchaeota archaeon]|nr:DUF2892 domain-containing protein [Candidatus Micrarchaeota archaeon]